MFTHIFTSLFFILSLLRRGDARRTITNVNPLRRSCVSDARNLGETAFVPGRVQPSAEIVRAGCAKHRRNCVTQCAWATLMFEMCAVTLGRCNHRFPFLRMSRRKRSFWKFSFVAFANVSYETLVLEGFPLRFCECLV